jgi:anaerobic magnesium-protoporphyrin IX monomethyl ester cyclase
MRVLIVATNREKTPIPVAPIGACNIATVLDAAGHTVDLVDLMWEKDPKRAIRRAVQSFKPELVGLSIRNLDNTSWMNNVWYLDDAKAYVDEAREAAGTKILVGGPAVGVLPGPIVAWTGADWGVWGDGERSVVEVVAAIEKGEDPADVLGVVTPNGLGPGQHRINEQYRVEEMGEIPVHRMWEWLDFKPYVRHSAPLQVQSRRGCAFKCTYCNYPMIEGSKYRRKSPEQVADEIEEMAKAVPGASIEFVDNTFNVPLRYCLQMLDAIIARDLDVTLHTNGFNPKATSIELMEKMDKAGMRQVMITPEVAHDGMLERLQKGFTMAQLRKALEHRKHLLTIGSKMEWLWVFLLGGPGETKASMEESFRFMRDEVPPGDPIFVQVGLRVYPGTPLQQEAIAEGVITEDDDLLQSFHYVSPDLEPMWIYDTLMDNIRQRPNITTLRDVMHPAFPHFLRVASLLKLKAPIAAGQPMMKMLSKLGLRRVGPEKR